MSSVNRSQTRDTNLQHNRAAANYNAARWAIAVQQCEYCPLAVHFLCKHLSAVKPQCFPCYLMAGYHIIYVLGISPSIWGKGQHMHRLCSYVLSKSGEGMFGLHCLSVLQVLLIPSCRHASVLWREATRIMFTDQSM